MDHKKHFRPGDTPTKFNRDSPPLEIEHAISCGQCVFVTKPERYLVSITVRVATSLASGWIQRQDPEASRIISFPAPCVPAVAGVLVAMSRLFGPEYHRSTSR